MSLQLIDGFEMWNDVPSAIGADIVTGGAGTSSDIKWAVGGTSAGTNYQTGRYSGSRAIEMGVSATADRRLAYPAGGLTFTNSDRWVVGFNVKIGSTVTTPSGYHRVMGWDQNGTNRVTLAFNVTTKTWAFFTTDSPSGTNLASGTPSKDPYQNWVYVEVEFYRDVSIAFGKLILWQENAAGKMEKVIEYTGQTDVFTLGSINRWYLASSFVSSHGSIRNLFDDVWWKTNPIIPDWSRPGELVQVCSYIPATDYQLQWTPSTGSVGHSLLDNQPRTSSDYVKATVAGKVDLYQIAALTGKPSNIYGVHGFSIGANGTSPGLFGISPTMRAVLRDSLGTDHYSVNHGWNLLQVYNQGVLLNNNPVTGAKWKIKDVLDIKWGFEEVGMGSIADIRVQDASLFVLQSIAQIGPGKSWAGVITGN